MKDVSILLSAAETSSDVHAAHLIDALEKKAQGKYRFHFFGIGGPELRKRSFFTIAKSEELLAMGFVELFGRIIAIFRAFRLLVRSVQERKPDLAILLDYPDFHFRFSKKLYRTGVPAIYYIPPKVWAWRSGRIKHLKHYFRSVLCILPFEESWYRKRGMIARYVGNPLTTELPLTTTREAARKELGLSENALVAALLPGSRPDELKRHTAVLIESSVRAAAIMRSKGRLGPQEKLTVLVGLAQTARVEKETARIQAALGASGGIVDLKILVGKSHLAMIAADFGVIKSGTSTLEAAILRLPHIIVYRGSRFTEWLFKNVIRYTGPVGLSNLVYGDGPESPRVVPEVLGPEMNVHRVSEEMVRLAMDSQFRTSLFTAFDLIRSRLKVDIPPSDQAADAVLELLENGSR